MSPSSMYRPFVLVLAFFASLCLAHGQDPAAYRTPKEPIASLITAAPPPLLSLSPCRRHIAIVQQEALPDLETIARPHEKLAGLRIDPKSRGPQLSVKTTKVTLRSLATLTERELALPPGHWRGVNWSADGERIAMERATDLGIELWVVEAATAACKQVPGVMLSAVLGGGAEWTHDQKHVLCMLAVDRAMPALPAAPSGPTLQESRPGERAQVRTNPDMLTSEHDAQKFEALATSQLARVSVETFAIEKLGAPALIASVSESPDGAFLLVRTVQRPFSYLVSWRDFPSRVDVWTRAGEFVRNIVEQPLRENVPIGGVETGPRAIAWMPSHPHALRWTVAQDDGDPRKKVAVRDHVYVSREPGTEPLLWFATEHRAMGVSVAQDGRLAMSGEFDRESRRVRMWRVDALDFAQKPVLLFERSMQDQYGDPGTPIDEVMPDGRVAMRQRNGLLFRSGKGASQNGERPFLDSWDPLTGVTARLWQCAEGRYEQFAGYLDDDHILIRSESPQEPPQYVKVTLSNGEKQGFLHWQDPALLVSKRITKELIRYQRKDGVALSATLYLPPDHQPGQKHPTLVWAYPQEFTRADDAGQVRASPTRYTRFAGISHLWLLLAGYAVLDDAAMPIVGPNRGANDTYVQQLTDDAQAAVDLLVSRGIADPAEIAVGGHSYGAFMSANLLCHTDLFATAIARSGAYNRTLTPFGFQNEERTFWEAQQVYMQMSPFAHADKVNEPILLIHGADDDNQGTWPIQSQRFYAAIKGHGGTARLCMLPHEAHGYRGRQSVLHCVWEMVDWLDRHVKGRAERLREKPAAPANASGTKQG